MILVVRWSNTVTDKLIDRFHIATTTCSIAIVVITVPCSCMCDHDLLVAQCTRTMMTKAVRNTLNSRV